MPRVWDWDELQLTQEWSSILLGNGASQAVWQQFGYRSLFEKACLEIDEPLTDEDQALFGDMETENFEVVLSALTTARRVNRSYGLPVDPVHDAYARVQGALGAAVRQAHIPWNDVPTVVHDLISDSLAEYRVVYSTNYDLLVYWSIIDHTDRFVDFFWNPTDDGVSTYFDRASATKYDNERHTKVLYLHGGLHLVTTEGEVSRKRKKQDYLNLLDQFGQPLQGYDEAVPLLVSEGSPADKMRVITNSDYLGYAYERFAADEAPLVVFGHGLGEADRHIANAINESGRPIAVSVRSTNPLAVDARQKALEGMMPNVRVFLFDARTHPLGDPALLQQP